MRQVVVEVACSRCERKEIVNEQTAAVAVLPNTSDGPPAFMGVLVADGGKTTVRWEDLCGPCLRTVRAALEQISKRIEGVSPDRATQPKKPKKEPTPVAASEAKKEETPPSPAAAPPLRSAVHPAAKASVVRSS